MQLACTYWQKYRSVSQLPGTETYPYRVIFMRIMKELVISPKVDRSDEAHILSSTILPDCAERSRPEYWIFVGPGSQNAWHVDKWDKAEHLDGNWIANQCRFWKFTPNLATQSSWVRRSSTMVLFAKKEVRATCTSIP